MKRLLIFLLTLTLLSCRKEVQHTYCFKCWSSFNGQDEGVKCSSNELEQFTDGRGNDLNCFEIH